MTTRLLVVGASGLVGSEVMRAASGVVAEPAGPRVPFTSSPSAVAESAQRIEAPPRIALGVARAVGGLASRAMDLLDPAAIERVVNAFQPDEVLIASAWPHVDGCEQDPARSERENVQTVKNVLQVVGHSVRVGFFSTEHVFDGQAPAYDERAPTHPLSVYAKHKRAVEELLLARGNALVARTSYVFGAEARRKNFMYRVIDASEQRTPLKVPSKQAGMPTWSVWLARSMLELLSRGLEGLVHLTGPDVLTKAEWAALLARGLDLPNVEITEVPWQESGQIAPRPERVRLLSTVHDLQHPPLARLLETERAALLRK
jgi:dTDP-4-dehydrorhamnose reductase